MFKPINRIFCTIITDSRDDLILSDASMILDKYSLAEIKVSSDDTFKAGMKVIIPTFSDKFEYEGVNYNVVHSSDIIGVCE